MGERLMVVSAHAADWVWRCSGTIAKYKKMGAVVGVVCLTHGERGESGELWKIPDQTVETVKETRRTESMAAAEFLGVDEFEIWDYPDHPLVATDEILGRLNEKFRQFRPTLVITHDAHDDTNIDHCVASDIAFEAFGMARHKGVPSQCPDTAGIVQIYGFEPSQTERSGYVPQVYIDVTDVWETKQEAMGYIKAQPKTAAIHVRVNTHRGWQAARMPGGKGIKYAESYSTRYPIILKDRLF
jgi:4-oxalomesaconate hydratase